MLVFQQLFSKKAKLPGPIKQKAIQFIPVVSNIGFNLKANTCDLKGSSPAIKMTLLYLLYLFSILYVSYKGFFFWPGPKCSFIFPPAGGDVNVCSLKRVKKSKWRCPDQVGGRVAMVAKHKP